MDRALKALVGRGFQAFNRPIQTSAAERAAKGDGNEGLEQKKMGLCIYIAISTDRGGVYRNSRCKFYESEFR